MLNSDELVEIIYNSGERLVPGETHDREEIVRHKSCYQFFLAVIESDILNAPSMLERPIIILDIGSGVGHGTHMLAKIINVEVVGIEPSKESVFYANQHYATSNLVFQNVSLEQYAKSPREVDYIVSRHALEHIDDGINLALKIKYRKRLMVNVPFNEAEGNIYHKLNWITEDYFCSYPNREFFYEDLAGETRIDRSEELHPNSIICVSSNPNLKKVLSSLPFPFQAWQPEYLQELGIRSLESKVAFRESAVLEKEAELVARAQSLGERECAIRSSELSLQASSNHLNTQQALLNERESALGVLASALQKLEADMQHRESVLNNKELDLTSRTAVINDLDCALRARETNINEALARYNKMIVVRLYRKLKKMVKK